MLKEGKEGGREGRGEWGERGRGRGREKKRTSDWILISLSASSNNFLAPLKFLKKKWSVESQ